MGWFDRTPRYVELADMRERWKNKEITTLEYHRYIEKTKRNLSQDKVTRYF